MPVSGQDNQQPTIHRAQFEIKEDCMALTFGNVHFVDEFTVTVELINKNTSNKALYSLTKLELQRLLIDFYQYNTENVILPFTRDGNLKLDNENYLLITLDIEVNYEGFQTDYFLEKSFLQSQRPLEILKEYPNKENLTFDTKNYSEVLLHNSFESIESIYSFKTLQSKFVESKMELSFMYVSTRYNLILPTYHNQVIKIKQPDYVNQEPIFFLRY